MNRITTGLGALALLLALGCGGKDKGGTTTPTPGDGAATGEPGPPDEGTPGDGGPADPAAGGEVPGDDGGQATGPDGAPAIVAPNLDPDPATARAEVEQHLEAGRAALRKDPPDGDAALAAARQALKVDATSIEAAAMVAHAYLAKNLQDTAELILDEINERDAAQRSATVKYLYGLVYDRQNKRPQAFAAYQQAVALDPNHASAQHNLGVHQLRNKQYGAAIATFERLTGPLRVSTAAVHTGLGAAYRGRTADYPPTAGERRDLLRKAEAAFKQAIALDKNYGPAYYDLGLLYFDSKPFPADGGGGALDELARLQRAKTYFDQYKNMPGADQKLYEARNKDVTRLIRREENARKPE